MGKYIILLLLFVILITGCAGFETKGSFSFKRDLNIKSYGYQRVSAPHPVRAGKSSERFEVRPGDCYWKWLKKDRKWDDCKADRERSELAELEPYSKLGREYWYGWSIFIPNDYTIVWPARTVLAQFHQKGETMDPPVLFHNFAGGYWFHINQIKQESYILIPEEEFRGRWHDILVQAKWTKIDGGFIRVWVNGVLKVYYSGALTDYSDPIYFRYGIYRHYLTEYKSSYNVDSVPVQVVYFDEVRKGKSRVDVDIRLRK